VPLLTAEIRSIIENRGLIKFPNQVAHGTPPVNTGIIDSVVANNYNNVELTVSTADQTISLTRKANDTPCNAVDIKTEDAMSMVGTVSAPGYIYTGDFSGCVFYLYRTGPGQVTGVHAYNGSQPVHKKVGIFRKKTITTQVVREFGPQSYFTRNPAQELCRYPTRGEMQVGNGEISLAFLSCVDTTTATTFLFAVSGGSAAGLRINRLIRAYHVKY
jgi:hypothetical protein